MSNLYNTIMELCERKGVKGAKMCTEAGISKGLLTDLKMGRRSGVSAVTAQKIANYFGVTVGYLLGEDEKESPTTQSGSEALRNAGYYQLNEDNKALIDQMIAQLIKSQSGD